MDRAVKNWVGYLESYPYELLNVSSAFGSGWCDPTTNRCSFENIDKDRDGIPDFYDPYNGNNNNFWNNPNAKASWLLPLSSFSNLPPHSFIL